MKKQVKLILAGVALLLCIAWACVALLRPTPVSAELLQYGDLSWRLSEQGTILSRDSYTVESRSAGYVTELLTLPGRAVSAGDALIALDDLDYQNALQEQIDQLFLEQKALDATQGMQSSQNSLTKEQLSAQLLSLEQSYQSLFGQNSGAQKAAIDAYNLYAIALDSYESSLSLFEIGAISRNELTHAETQYQAAEAAYHNALYESSDANRSYYEQQIRSIRSQIALIDQGGQYSAESSQIQSQQLQLKQDLIAQQLQQVGAVVPVSGILGDLYVEKGQYVLEHQPIAVILSDGARYIEVLILDEDAYYIQENSLIDCILPDGSSFEAKLSFRSPLVTEQLSSIGLTESRRLMELSADGIPHSAGIGSKVSLSFRTVLAEEVLTVSSSAAVPLEEGYGVYVIENNKLRLRPVTLGQRASGRIEVTDGLTEGDLVLSNPYQEDIREGLRVKVNMN